MKKRRLPETDHYNLLEIDTDVPQNRNPAKCDLRPVNGLDTETDEGDIFLLADSDGKYIDRDITVDSVMEFLLHKKYQNAYNLCYNLHYDAIVILKLLGEQLKDYLSTRSLVFQYKDYVIKYIPQKCLAIGKGHKSVSLFDVAQFYRTDLLLAYQSNIGPAQEWYKDQKKKRPIFSRRYYRRHTTLVRNYCIEDCKMTKELGEHWLSLYHKATGMYPRRILSAGYLVEKAMISRGVDIPRFSDLQYSSQYLAYSAYFSGRVEMLKRGSIGEAYLYDVNSAYPHKIAQLPNLRRGEWVDGPQVDQKATVGFFRIVANVPDSISLAPFPFRANNIFFFPAGRFVTYATIDELRACKNRDYYWILQSRQFIPQDPNHHPYAEFVKDYYAKKSELKEKGDPLYLPFKVMLNSVYGKTGETVVRGHREVIGNLFNPVIFATITGSSRAQLYRYITENRLENEVVYMYTDSICTTRNLGVDSKALGEFSRKDHALDVFCVQNGVNRFNGIWKERGIGNMNGRRIENTKIYEENGRVFMKIKVERVKNLKSAIVQNKISEIGKFSEVTREIDLNADRKRFWPGRLTSLNDDQFNDSMPLSLNHFSKEEI